MVVTSRMFMLGVNAVGSKNILIVLGGWFLSLIISLRNRIQRRLRRDSLQRTPNAMRNDFKLLCNYFSL